MYFFFNDTAHTEIYTLSLHDALPIFPQVRGDVSPAAWPPDDGPAHLRAGRAAHGAGDGTGGVRPALRRRPQLRTRVRDRKSTRLNSSHGYISYAVFCLKKKTTQDSIS